MSISVITADQIGGTAKQYKDVLLIDALRKQKALCVFDNALYLRTLDSLARLVPLGNEGQRLIRKSLLATDANRLINKLSLDNVIDNIMVDPSFETESLHLAESKILWNNGVFDLATGTFSVGDAQPSNDGMSPTMNYLYKLNANYIDSSSLEDTPNFAQYLSSSLEKDTIPLFLEALGYILSPVQKLKKAVFLIGRPNTGKSVILALIRNLLGLENISELDLTQIGQRNENAPLLGKQCNISEDIGSTNKFNLSDFKRAVANESITMSNKYERSITAPVRAKFVVAGNAFPHIPLNELPPFIERVLLIPFIKEIPKEEQNLNLIDALIKEKDYIASLAVNAFSSSLKYGFSNSATSQKFINQLLNELNPTKAFIEDCIVKQKNGLIRSSDFKYLLVLYCKKNGYEIPKPQLARRVLLQMHNTHVQRKRLKNSLGNVQCFIDIAFKPDEIESLDVELANKIKSLSSMEGSDNLERE